jgi:hypothetical protein
MNNEVEYIPCTMNEKLLQNEHIDSKGSRLSTRSKETKIFMGNVKQGVYPLQAKGNIGKCEIRIETMLKIVSSQAILAQLTRTVLQYTIKILEVLLIKQKNYYCHFLRSYHINLHVRASFKRL